MDLSRRGLLAGAAASAASLALGVPTGSKSAQSKRSLRIAFLTDIHLDDNSAHAEGLRRCLRKVHGLEDRPDLIIQGGDCIFDALTRDSTSVGRQYAVLGDTFRRACSLPVEHVLGNHDIWGWGRQDADQLRADARFGKAWWLQWTGYDRTYRWFDKADWRFIVLDSMVNGKGTGYQARLDQTQFDWLEDVLAKTDRSRPVCLVSHIPVISAGAMFFNQEGPRGGFSIPNWLMHSDARRIKALLAKYQNVKTCLSGHIHLHSRVDYNGVKHIGFGAVCGAWWKGALQETPPGFGIVDFFRDGTLKHYYLPY